ncbi:hypothetical protein MYSTI_07761 [Myxococcus stipitatus DSM 14675]|uniref:Uncharacterized protein n=1 Tax=Myxococcus stipitatus (strain DSM 14675 / JCM 12634 / Mx s8) TaxID=1278073 RepID=L7ULZ0_MYXSD|nr:hypothetical protein MYSTI_07761 [Myxococcus stipitatus DSM 14675]
MLEVHEHLPGGHSMVLRWAAVLLFLAVSTGCATSRVVRLETGRESFVVTPREEPGAEVSAAELDDDEFAEVLAELGRDVRPLHNPMQWARELFGVPSRSGVFGYEGHPGRLIPQRADVDGLHLLESYSDDGLTKAYGQWCERKDQPGDCLRLLVEGPLLASDGKYTWAFAIAMDSVWDETAEALEDMADPGAVMATVTSAATEVRIGALQDSRRLPEGPHTRAAHSRQRSPDARDGAQQAFDSRQVSPLGRPSCRAPPATSCSRRTCRPGTGTWATR